MHPVCGVPGEASGRIKHPGAARRGTSDKCLYVNFGLAPLLDETAVAASAPPENLHP